MHLEIIGAWLSLSFCVFKEAGACGSLSCLTLVFESQTDEVRRGGVQGATAGLEN